MKSFHGCRVMGKTFFEAEGVGIWDLEAMWFYMSREKNILIQESV